MTDSTDDYEILELRRRMPIIWHDEIKINNKKGKIKMFKKAEKQKSKLRLAISGASGSGKTYSALTLGCELGSKIAVIDTEFGSASLYSDKFNFDVLELSAPFSPDKCINAIKSAENAGYEVLIIDSISHEWNGEGGCLDLQTKLGGRYTDWAKITPLHDRFINAILQSKLHVICTMRSKTNYETSKDERGRTTYEKKGLAPVQRDSIEYEFTVVFDLNQNHLATSSKDRTSLFNGQIFIIDKDVSNRLSKWLESGVDNAPKKESKALEFVFGEIESQLDELTSIQKIEKESNKLQEELKASLKQTQTQKPTGIKPDFDFNY